MTPASLSQAIRSLELPDANLLAALCVMEPGVWQSPTEIQDQLAMNSRLGQRLGKLARLDLLEARRPPWGPLTLYAAAPFGRHVNALIDDPRSVGDAWTRAHLSTLRQRGHTAAHAAAIAACMWEAGFDSDALASWWRRSRSELGGRSPREALHEDQPAVLALAREDAEREREQNRRVAEQEAAERVA